MLQALRDSERASDFPSACKLKHLPRAIRLLWRGSRFRAVAVCCWSKSTACYSTWHAGAVSAPTKWPRICVRLKLCLLRSKRCPCRTFMALGALAERHGLSVYDATYLQFALRMRLTLATLDRALAAAAKTAGVNMPATL